jgi:hypothetical protein
VELLVQHGFRFFPVHDGHHEVPYPKMLREAREFVRRFGPDATRDQLGHELGREQEEAHGTRVMIATTSAKCRVSLTIPFESRLTRGGYAAGQPLAAPARPAGPAASSPGYAAPTDA